jgi:hypothetical protein
VFERHATVRWEHQGNWGSTAVDRGIQHVSEAGDSATCLGTVGRGQTVACASESVNSPQPLFKEFSRFFRREDFLASDHMSLVCHLTRDAAKKEIRSRLSAS